MADDAAVGELDHHEMARNPQPIYKMTRDHAPVLEMDMQGFTGVMVSKHEDVMTVLRSPDVYSSDDAVDIGQVRPLIPLMVDPPNHAKFRKLLDPLFAPKQVATLEDSTRELVVSLIDPVVPDGGCNFHQTVAEPLPSTVFLQLLGLPVERAGEFIELKDGIIRPPAQTPEQRKEMVDATGARIYAVLEEVVADRAGERRDDFISGFLDAEVEGHRLTHDEIVDICYLFFLAGLDTVTASLDCMVSYLAQHPEQRRRVADDPALIPHAVEEMLRWETPVTGVVRKTAVDAELSGCPIAAGTRINVSLGSANTDEAFWEHADDVDFDREINKHIAFGAGVHRCLGSHLARMELRVALEEWHRQVPDYRLADGLQLDYSPGLRQVENLELVW